MEEKLRLHARDDEEREMIDLYVKIRDATSFPKTFDGACMWLIKKTDFGVKKGEIARRFELTDDEDETDVRVAYVRYREIMARLGELVWESTNPKRSSKKVLLRTLYTSPSAVRDDTCYDYECDV